MSTNTSVAVGVEIGGSRATIALVDQRGRVLHRLYAKTLRGRPALATLEPYLREIETILDYANRERYTVSGLGICIPGTLDAAQRRPALVPLLPSLNNFPLCELLEARYEIPAQLHVDVDAAILGEHRFGAGRGFHRLLFLTVNAVVGAAMVVDDKIERSAQQYVGHICHIPVSSSGPRCSCGKRGCINTMVSSDAMQKMVQRALRRGEETSLLRRLSNREYFSPQLLAEEAGRGDSVALQVYSEVGRWLGAATAKYITIFEPHVLILGGGVLGTSDLLLTQVRQILTTDPALKVCRMIDVVPAHLGVEACLIGAAVPFLFSACPVGG